jgi:hypothetical protein
MRSVTRDLTEGYPVNQLDACIILKDIWDQYKSETVIHCFIKASILPDNVTFLLQNKYQRAHDDRKKHSDFSE